MVTKGKEGEGWVGSLDLHVQTAIFINEINDFPLKKELGLLKIEGQLIFILIGNQLMYRMQVRLSSTGHDS